MRHVKEVGGILLPDLAAHEVGNKEPTQVTKRINSPKGRLSKLRPRQLLQGCREGLTHYLV